MQAIWSLFGHVLSWQGLLQELDIELLQELDIENWRKSATQHRTAYTHTCTHTGLLFDSLDISNSEDWQYRSVHFTCDLVAAIK